MRRGRMGECPILDALRAEGAPAAASGRTGKAASTRQRPARASVTPRVPETQTGASFPRSEDQSQPG
jgi:hypothetical protein